jgi:DNA-binding Lrp family transcriptional regulator
MTRCRPRRHIPLRELIPKSILDAFTQSDLAVLKYLDKLAREKDGEACTASIPRIASACGISERQVQICTTRLIEAKLLKRVGYDFGNPNKAKRGSIYKILVR